MKDNSIRYSVNRSLMYNAYFVNSGVALSQFVEKFGVFSRQLVRFVMTFVIHFRTSLEPIAVVFVAVSESVNITKKTATITMSTDAEFCAKCGQPRLVMV